MVGFIAVEKQLGIPVAKPAGAEKKVRLHFGLGVISGKIW